MILALILINFIYKNVQDLYATIYHITYKQHRNAPLQIQLSLKGQNAINQIYVVFCLLAEYKQFYK
jgi:hypothetical protein